MRTKCLTSLGLMLGYEKYFDNKDWKRTWT